MEKQPVYRRNTAHAVMDTKQVCRTKYHRSHESRQQLYFRRILVTPREPFRWVGRTRIQPLSLCATKQAVPHLLHLAPPVHGPIYHRRLFLPTIQLCPHGQRNHPRYAQSGRSRHRRDSTIDRQPRCKTLCHLQIRTAIPIHPRNILRKTRRILYPRSRCDHARKILGRGQNTQPGRQSKECRRITILPQHTHQCHSRLAHPQCCPGLA